MGRMVIIKKSFTNPKSIYAILLLGIFTFLFLGAEYLYVKYDLAYGRGRKNGDCAKLRVRNKRCRFFALSAVSSLFEKAGTNRWTFYPCTSSGSMQFFGSKTCFLFVHSALRNGIVPVSGDIGKRGPLPVFKLAKDRTHLARMVGISYALGIFLQFLNNNLVDLETAEALILSLFALVALALLLKAERLCRQENAEAEEPQSPAIEAIEEDGKGTRKKIAAGGFLALLVILMACIFSTLDNAVTMHHAAGTDIGQWPRLLLAVSGLSAGFLFDIRKRKFMTMMMYCVMLMSVICVVVLKLGGPFLIGLIVFYLSAGFFVVFFTTSFLDFARHMPTPALWAVWGAP